MGSRRTSGVWQGSLTPKMCWHAIARMRTPQPASRCCRSAPLHSPRPLQQANQGHWSGGVCSRGSSSSRQARASQTYGSSSGSCQRLGRVTHSRCLLGCSTMATLAISTPSCRCAGGLHAAHVVVTLRVRLMRQTVICGCRGLERNADMYPAECRSRGTLHMWTNALYTLRLCSQVHHNLVWSLQQAMVLSIFMSAVVYTWSHRRC